MSHTILLSCTGCTACLKICPVLAICGERKSLHVIDAVMCIDCGACARICPSQAVLDALGELCMPAIKRSLWPRPVVLEKKCVSCGLCLESCPTGVMAFADLQDHQVRAVAVLRDPRNCIACAFCAAACPVEAILMRGSGQNSKS